MMSKLQDSLAGPGYVILNALRALNIITFLDIIASCVVMLVKINNYNGFFFFQAVTHAIMALISSKSSLGLFLLTFHEILASGLWTCTDVFFTSSRSYRH